MIHDFRKSDSISTNHTLPHQQQTTDDEDVTIFQITTNARINYYYLCTIFPTLSNILVHSSVVSDW